MRRLRVRILPWSPQFTESPRCNVATGAFDFGGKGLKFCEFRTQLQLLPNSLKTIRKSSTETMPSRLMSAVQMEEHPKSLSRIKTSLTATMPSWSRSCGHVGSQMPSPLVSETQSPPQMPNASVEKRQDPSSSVASNSKLQASGSVHPGKAGAQSSDTVNGFP